jgi:hypothetical protein
MTYGVRALAAAALMFAGTAQAATFTETLDLPAFFSQGPRVLQATSSFTSGLKLSAADQISNPSNWNNALNVTLDTDAQTISLTGDGFNTYQLIWIDISNIVGTTITGLSAIDPFGAIGAVQGGFGYSTSFTANSISIRFEAADIQARDLFEINQGTSVFRYETGVVPEPQSWALMILGFGAVGIVMRRRQTAVAA